MNDHRYKNSLNKHQNENREVNKGMKRAKKEKHIKKENVWDRLSRVKKSPSSEISGINKTKPYLANKPSQRAKVVKRIAEGDEQEKNSRRPLAPTSSINRHFAGIKQTQKSVTTSEIAENGLLFVAKPIKSVQEILSVRSLNNSHTSLEVYKISSNECYVESQSNISLSSLSDQFSNIHLDEIPKVHTSLISVRSDLKDSTIDQGNAEMPMNPIHSKDSLDIFKLFPLMSSTLNEKTSLEMNDHSVSDESAFSDESAIFVDVPSEAAINGPKLDPLSSPTHLKEHSPKLEENIELSFSTTNITLQSITESDQFIDMPSEDSIVEGNIPQNSPTYLIDCSSPKIMQDFQEVLQNCGNQLKDIAELKYAAKKALENLVQVQESGFEDETYYDCPKLLENACEKLPSLQKEILLLKALGVKLQATLEQTQKTQQTIGVNTELSLMAASKQVKHSQLQPYILPMENYAHSSVMSKGLRCETGIAQEYIIAQKTIVELKEEAHLPFYIPIKGGMAELQKTTFQQLKENPSTLMPHIKAKSSLVRFNVLEQDALFFNNMLFNKIKYKSSKFKFATTNETQDENEDHTKNFNDKALMPNETQDVNVEVKIKNLKDKALKSMLCEGGHSQEFNKMSTFMPKDLINMEHNSNLESDTEHVQKIATQSILREGGCSHEFQQNILKKSDEEDNNLSIVDDPQRLDTKLFDTQPILKEKQRRRIRLSTTPFPVDKTLVSPKNNLMKTILVGFVQISCFMLFIMAFTFPDVICESPTKLF